MIVNILTKGLESPNGRAFLFPLLIWGKDIFSAGIRINYFQHLSDRLTDCDVLIIENKFFAPYWNSNANWVEEKIEEICSGGNKTFWFDITDSSGWDHLKALDYVTAVIKNQVLTDKMQYLEPIYANGRLFSDFVNREFGIEDSNPSWSLPISNPELLKKIYIGWNSGLADYSLFGPAKMSVYRKIKIPFLLNYSEALNKKLTKRKYKVSCRFGVSYERETVRWQREQIRKKMANIMETKKINRLKYFQELRNSDIVVSPFGLGEITLKDFEVFLSGSTLFKPDMSHMKTWPNFFVAAETMETHSWDLSDFHDKLEQLLSNKNRRLAIAENGKKVYEKYTVGKEAPELFINHFKSILEIGG